MIRKTTIILFLILLIVYISIGAMLFFRQKEMIYFPTNHDFDTCPGFKDVEKINESGTRAYFKRNSSTLVVFYHGNAGSACDRVYIRELIEEAGHSFLLPEYAGYSGDKKQPSKELLLEDARNMAVFIEKQDFERVLLIGESLGTAITAHHAQNGKYDKMLLITPFDSFAKIAKKTFPLFPTKLLLNEDYNNVEMLKDKDNVWIVHGTVDSIIPIEHSKKLFEKMQGKNNHYIEIEGADHNNIMNFKETARTIRNFLK